MYYWAVSYLCVYEGGGTLSKSPLTDGDLKVSSRIYMEDGDAIFITEAALLETNVDGPP